MNLIVEKALRRLSVVSNGEILAVYRISLGFMPAGKKSLEGDGKTPEGEYRIAVKNPESRYFRSLGLNYPNADDALAAFNNGIINKAEFTEIAAANHPGQMPPQKTALGGEIYIHGGGTNGDWTKGCIALADGDMLQLFEMAEVGSRVIIVA